MQYSYNIIVDSPCEITADFAKANQLIIPPGAVGASAAA